LVVDRYPVLIMIRSRPPSVCARGEKNRPFLTWIKPASPSSRENSNGTGALEPTRLTEGKRTGLPREALMREFLVAAAVSAIIIGVMLGIG
jgi:hypothetical protein